MGKSVGKAKHASTKAGKKRVAAGGGGQLAADMATIKKARAEAVNATAAKAETAQIGMNEFSVSFGGVPAGVVSKAPGSKTWTATIGPIKSKGHKTKAAAVKRVAEQHLL